MENVCLEKIIGGKSRADFTEIIGQVAWGINVAFVGKLNA
jgi:hypothetical protein